MILPAANEHGSYDLSIASDKKIKVTKINEISKSYYTYKINGTLIEPEQDRV